MIKVHRYFKKKKQVKETRVKFYKYNKEIKINLPFSSIIIKKSGLRLCIRSVIHLIIKIKPVESTNQSNSYLYRLLLFYLFTIIIIEQIKKFFIRIPI